MTEHEFVVINVDKFIENHPDIQEHWNEVMQYEFPDFESYRQFHIEMGTAYPDGVPVNYFMEKFHFYTTTLALRCLVEKGFLEEIEMEDGQLGYKKTALFTDEV